MRFENHLEKEVRTILDLIIVNKNCRTSSMSVLGFHFLAKSRKKIVPSISIYLTENNVDFEKFDNIF